MSESDVRLQVRRDTLANWTTENPTLAAGEMGFETDSQVMRIGDGATAFLSLPADALQYKVYGTVALLIASTEASRGTGAMWEVKLGDPYEEAASGATDHQETTAGGVKLYATTKELKPYDTIFNQLIGGVSPADDSRGIDLNDPAGGAIVVAPRIDNKANIGVSIGVNVYADSLTWGPLNMNGGWISNLNTDLTGSCSGVIAYSQNAIVSGVFVENASSTTGADIEGFYSKSAYSVWNGLIAKDFGTGEGSFNFKGEKRGGTAAPLGHNIIANACLAHFSNAYNATAAGIGVDTKGFKFLNDRQMGNALMAENVTGYGFAGAAGELEDITLSNLYGADSNDEGFYFPTEGGVHTIRGFKWRGAALNLVRLQGHTAASEYHFEDGVLFADGVNYLGAPITAVRAFYLKPTTDSVLDVTLRNILVDGVSDFAIRGDTATIKRLEIDGFRLRNGASRIFQFSEDVEEVHLRNFWRDGFQTTGTLADYEFLPVPIGKCAVFRIRATGDDGTDRFVEDTHGIAENIAGTVTILNTAVVYSHSTAGAAGWLTSYVTSGNNLRIRANGGSGGTPANWRFDIDFESV